MATFNCDDLISHASVFLSLRALPDPRDTKTPTGSKKSSYPEHTVTSGFSVPYHIFQLDGFSSSSSQES